MQKSINLEKGLTISELEAMFLILNEMLDRRMEENPKAGMKIKDKNGREVKMKYKDAKRVLNEVRNSFAYKGCFSFGICKTCSNFRSHMFAGRKNYGYCGDNMKHAFDTCSKHSLDGGGFGLEE